MAKDPSKEEIPEDLFRRWRHRGNLLYQSLCASYLSSSPRSLNSSVCLRRRVYDVYEIHQRKYTRVTFTTLHGELAEPRDIRGSQFIFLVDSSKNLLRYVVVLKDEGVADALRTSPYLRGISRTIVAQSFPSFTPIREESFYRGYRYSIKIIRPDDKYISFLL